MRRHSAGTHTKPGSIQSQACLLGTVRQQAKCSPSVLSLATLCFILPSLMKVPLLFLSIREKTGWLALPAMNSRPHGSPYCVC